MCYICNHKQKQRVMTQVLNLSIDYDLLADKVAERLAGNPPVTGEKADKGQKVYGIRGIAEYIGCSPAKAQNMKNAGILPFYEVGRRVFFYTSEVDKALKKEDR